MTDLKEYPLYPTLGESGKKAAQDLIDQFKKELIKLADNAIDGLYTDVATHIEEDSWTNFRNDMLDGFKNYDNRLICDKYAFADIRKAIYKQFREEIIADLNQDMIKEIEDLKRHIEIMQNDRY